MRQKFKALGQRYCVMCRRSTYHKLTRALEWLCSVCGHIKEDNYDVTDSNSL